MTDELRSVHGQLRKLRLEKIGLDQEIGKIKGDAQLINAENVFAKILNGEGEKEADVSNEVMPIKRCSQNIDFSRLETRKKGKSLNMTEVIRNIFTEENKENLNNTTVEHTDATGNETKRDNVKTEDLSAKKVMFSENAVIEIPADKSLMCKGTKIIKSKPLVVTSYKKK